MIFYFSGTGNSSYVAHKIAKNNNEQVISIPQEMKQGKDSYEYNLQEEEIIGFVYPVYAWAPPKMVIDFISKLTLHNYKNNYLFSIATCGANIGNTMGVLQEALKKKGLALQSGFSLVMPNNYIIMGDVDSEKKVAEKLSQAEERLAMINQVLAKKQTGIFQLEKGKLPLFLTGLINSLFNKHGMDSSKYYATDACTSCGLCERVCLTGTISVNKKPVWGANCTQCLACIHRCHTRAIQYGKGTIKKGRYQHPVG